MTNCNECGAKTLMNNFVVKCVVKRCCKFSKFDVQITIYNVMFPFFQCHLAAAANMAVSTAGPCFNLKISYHLILQVWADPMLKEIRLVRRLSVNMGLPILVRRIFILKRGPGTYPNWLNSKMKFAH